MILGEVIPIFYYLAMKSIRPLTASDKSSWDPLWQGYLKFYKTELSDEQSELTWQRLLDPDFNMYCLVAEVDGAIQGITHYSFQNSTWAEVNYCYLEDLYVEPQIKVGMLGGGNANVAGGIGTEPSVDLVWEAGRRTNLNFGIGYLYSFGGDFRFFTSHLGIGAHFDAHETPEVLHVCASS
jgi:hypothetical protein